MAETTKFIEATKNIKDLAKGMIITAYIGFSKQYNSMDKEACRFVQHNFKKAKAQVYRQEEKLDVYIEEVVEGDTLLRVFEIPPDLKKLTIVSEKLKTALQRRGFLEFDVKYPELTKDEKEELKDAIDLVKSTNLTVSEKKEKQKQAKAKTNDFIQTVNKNIKTGKEASKAVENIMDNARRGKVGIDDVKNYVDNITANSSSEAISAIISLKQSDQTYDHCVDVGVIFQTNYFKIVERKGERGIFQTKNQAMLGAFMHDFGKSKIPKDILDSTARFDRDSREMKMMQSHPKYGAELLSGMNMPESIVNMSYYHHVKLDTKINSCYPRNIDFSKVIYETRLLGLIDIYQALVGRRKYKKSWNPPAAIRYLDALAGVEYDLDVWDEFVQTIGYYPLGSLVELNDKTIGFVVNVPEKDLEKPQVAIVRNANGEDLVHHDLIDLEDEEDISIERDLDVRETFGAKALKIFASINVS